jgi:hypothetical protein
LDIDDHRLLCGWRDYDSQWVGGCRKGCDPALFEYHCPPKLQNLFGYDLDALFGLLRCAGEEAAFD